MEPAGFSASVKITSTVVTPLVRKLFARPGRGAGLVDRPVRVSGLVAWRGEKRSLTEQDVRGLATELVRRATADAAGPHESPVAADERRAVADALARSLLALGELDMEDVQAVHLGPEAFARALRERTPGADRELSADGSVLLRGLLDLACLHILHFFTQRSTFVARTLVDQSRSLDTIVHRLDALLERTPPPPVQDAEFERDYHAYTRAKYGKLTILGVDLSRRDRARWSLDTSYLSLEVSAAREQQPEEFDGGPQRVEQALANASRVLLRGAAGSGKTTLIQWLATSATDGTLEHELPELHGRVPYLLPLRTISRRRQLPSPADFLAAVGNPLDGAQPPGWADRVLRSGRGLLLVDGVDEVPEPERRRTRDWLQNLLIAFPRSVFVVTSRPSAVPRGWLDEGQFTDLFLLPMNYADVAAFITRWHDTARAGCAAGENEERENEERAELDAYESSLLETVRTKDDLGRLATNPLMCALICALYRDRHGRLPDGRMELYAAALSMFLVRRDEERRVDAPEGLQPSEGEHVQLLQKLAYWLIRNGRSEAEQSTAIRIIEDALPAMPQVAAPGDAPRVFRHLLLRSGLLREPFPEAVDFVHRTFQDYLGAKAAVEAQDIDFLVHNAHDDQWEDVIRMAVGHARPAERTDLLRKLVARGDRDKASRHRLHLLAAASLDQATELDPGTRATVQERAAALIPPRGPDEAGALVRAGKLALDLLPGPDGLAEEEAVQVVGTAAEIGGDPALEILKRFREHPSRRVAEALNRAWPKFDAERYGREVMASLPLGEGRHFSAYDPLHLDLLRSFDDHPRISCVGSFTSAELAGHLDAAHVEELWVIRNTTLKDLEFAPRLTRLTRLDVVSCKRVADFDPLRGLGLRSLALVDLSMVHDPTFFTDLPDLVHVRLNSPIGLNRLPITEGLRELVLGPQTMAWFGARGISRWERLEVLRFEAPCPPALGDELARMRNLRVLALEQQDVAGLRGRAPMPQVENLRLTDPHGTRDLGPVLHAFPGLRTLRLVWRQLPGERVKLNALKSVPDLTVHVRGASRVTGAELLAEGHVTVGP